MLTLRIGRAVVLLLVAIPPVVSACTGAAKSGVSAEERKAQCERDRGVWRPEIAGGYCEMKP